MNSPCKIMVTGSLGQLGTEIRKQSVLVEDSVFNYFDIDNLDITNADAVHNTINSIKPDYIINCAAYTAVDKAEDDTESAFSINAYGVGNIVSALSEEMNTGLIHVSTDFVFSGDENEKPYNEDFPPMPLSVYGRSKLLGEEFAANYNKSMIIRTSWLYSEWGNNFVKTIMRLSREGKSLNVVNDQTGSPTWAADLGKAILDITNMIRRGEKAFVPGIYHYSNEGECNWYDFACEIRNICGFSNNISAVSSEEYPQAAIRPAYSVMSKKKITEAYSIETPYWKDSLGKCINNLLKHEND